MSQKDLAYEGSQIKLAIRRLFVSSREGIVYTEGDPLRVVVEGVNGSDRMVLCLYKHPTKPGAVVMWYEAP